MFEKVSFDKHLLVIAAALAAATALALLLVRAPRNAASAVSATAASEFELSEGIHCFYWNARNY